MKVVTEPRVASGIRIQLARKSLKIINSLSSSLYPARYSRRSVTFSRPLRGLIRLPDRTSIGRWLLSLGPLHGRHACLFSYVANAAHYDPLGSNTQRSQYSVEAPASIGSLVRQNPNKVGNLNNEPCSI